MKRLLTYRFYKGLRFRIGAIFGGLFLVCLLGVGWLLYRNVTKQFERSFSSQLKSGANAVLAKTETAPLIVPLPDSGDYFLLTYQNGITTDTLFNNLSTAINTNPDSNEWRSVEQKKSLEGGGELRIVYAQNAASLDNAITSLQQILFVYFPLSLLISFVVAYFLSGFLLQPISAIINRAKNISLQTKFELLKVPAVEDELHQLTVTLNGMLERIEEQSKQQTNFFAAAAHELRTPLSNMLTELQVMQAGELNGETKKLVQSQVAEVQRLKKLVNDFLLVSQLKSGMLPVTKQKINLVEICTEAIERLASKAAQNGHRFRLKVLPEDGDFMMQADRDHIEIIMSNLLENAVKYSQPSSTVDLQLKQSTDYVEVTIRNKTQSAVSLENLTKEFVRKDLSKDGFGLGLWLVKQLLSLNDGVLDLNSSQNYFTATVNLENVLT